MLETNLTRKLEIALQAIEIHSYSSFSWFGKRESILPSNLLHTIPSVVARDHLLHTIQQRLYSQFYCLGQATLIRPDSMLPIRSWGNSAFLMALSDANNGIGYWEEGWTVRSIINEGVGVRRNELSFIIASKDCRGILGKSIEIGMTISIHMPKELKAISPGFYLALGDVVLYRINDSALVRIYLNLSPKGAIRFVSLATSELNRAQLPFRLKVINQPSQFHRCDTVVLYINKNDYDSIRNILEKIYSQFSEFLRTETPVFTKPVSGGIGVAEDPGFGPSFGLHRCGLLAESILRAYEQRKKSLCDRLQAVEDTFHEHLIPLEKSYLNPGSVDVYGFTPLGDPSRDIRTRDNATAHEESGQQQFLETALQIGQLLAKGAIWHEGQCNWLGTELDGHNTHTSQRRQLAYQALGPDIYSGTSGIALFLAELHTTFANDQIRQTALAAIRQALSQVPKLLAAGRFGFYDGVIGILFVTSYIGFLLGEDELQERAAQLLLDIAPTIQQNSTFDLISGSAGVIVALLTLERMSPKGIQREFATRLGEELMHAAEQQEDTLFWKSPAFPRQQALTGFSHGTAGIAYALLELFHATGDLRYLDAADMAFDYERMWFYERMQNWPDFRGIRARKKQCTRHLDYPVVWCHGAPGIALSRLRAFEISQENRWKSEALTALNTTQAWTQSTLDIEEANFCLCHGLAGNAQILLKGSQTLREDFASGYDLANNVAATGFKKYARRGHQWPLGTLGERSPGLMTGLSGIGFFYLSLADPTLPSILLLEAEKIRGRLGLVVSRGRFQAE
jgi:Lanthionine synthetase C-like protein/HopA1 effector protein family